MEKKMTTWNIDPDHAVAAFKVRHLMIANVRGQFNAIHGTVHFNPEDPGSLALEARVEVAGIYTGIRKRDEHLRSPDFFDADTFPDIFFHSTEFTSLKENRGRLAGELIIHGITRPVTLETLISGPVRSPAEIGGETTLGLAAATAINRYDFGMTWNIPLSAAELAIGREIEILLDIEADLEE
jgi:polyisoprenoid-binding protein YceI